MTSLNKGQRPYEVTEILNYDLDGEIANAELKQLRKQCLDCEMAKEQIVSEFSYYRDGHIPKHIAGLFQFLNSTSLKFEVTKDSSGYSLTNFIHLVALITQTISTYVLIFSCLFNTRIE